MTESLKAFADRNGVKFFLFNFTDLFGVQRAKLVPASAIADMQAGGAGFAGFASAADPGKRLDIDIYAEPHKARGGKELPLNLLDALRALKQDKALCAATGDDFTDAYLKLKHDDWMSYARHLTEWERAHTLDCQAGAACASTRARRACQS